MGSTTMTHRSAGAAGRALGQGEEDAELATQLRVAVTRLNRRLRQQSLAGLSPAQASVLGAVQRLGSPTLGELAHTEQVQPPSMTRLVGSCEAAGLVLREEDPGDRRVCRIALTGEGRKTLQRIQSLKTAFLSQRIAELDADERAALPSLAALLEKLVAP